MSSRKALTLTEEQIAAINDTVTNGDRVEIIPTKEGAKVIRIMRREIKIKRGGQ